MNKSVVFLVPALSQPRCIKRITSIMNMGYKCYVYGYKRGKYDVNAYPEEIDVEEFDIIKDGDYFHKAIKGWKDIVKVILKHKSDDCLFYAFGFFNAFICSFKGLKYVYEISDVFYAYPKLRYIQWILKLIDKRLINRAFFTVMTSGGFQNFFSLQNCKILLLPNKVSPRLSYVNRKPLNIVENKLKFAFVGSIRYDTILRFAETIGENYPQHSFYFFGSAIGVIKDKIEALLSRYNNIKFYGVYRSPDDLERIYDEIDIVVACYDVKSENERIAEPNKLYESLFFCKPIVVSDNIFLSHRVQELDCGYSIDASSKDNISKFVDGLEIARINQISKSEYNIPKDQIIDSPSKLELFLSGF